MKEKSAPTALVVIIASVVIILLVFGYASSKVKAQKPEYMPITSQTQLPLDKDVSTEDVSEKTIVGNDNTSGTIIAPNTGNNATGKSGSASVAPPSQSGPSITDAFGDILWQEK